MSCTTPFRSNGIGPDFDASKNEIAIETIELAVEGFNRMGG